MSARTVLTVGRVVSVTGCLAGLAWLGPYGCGGSSDTSNNPNNGGAPDGSLDDSGDQIDASLPPDDGTGGGTTSGGSNGGSNGGGQPDAAADASRADAAKPDAGSCGDGIVEGKEQCDDGNANNADGCKNDCTFTCADAAKDCSGTSPPCTKWSCNAKHVCASEADATKDGKTCSGAQVCKAGVCGITCGNGTTEPWEQCDFGTGKNGPGTGCETDCRFSCELAPDTCSDGNACNGVEMCKADSVSSHPGQKCAAGTPAADGTACGTGDICLGQQCKVSRCGDGYINVAAGEKCEPPNTATCDSQCHIPPPCNLNGAWATKITFNVSWPSSIALTAGSGSTNVWLLIQRTQNGTTLTDVVSSCGGDVPDFKGSSLGGGETYGSILPNSLFDSATPGITKFTMTNSVSSTNANATFTANPFAGEIGANLANPITDAWPSAAALPTYDVESDGLPGATSIPKSGGPYSLPPLDFLKSRRTDQLDIATRFVTSLSGTVGAACDQITGGATPTKNDLHVLGCHVFGGGACTTAQANFIDGNSLVFTFTPGSSFTMKKVPAGSSCATVRSTL